MPIFLFPILLSDRTFNVGKCYLTQTCYQNTDLVNADGTHPYFYGPMMLHFNGQTQSYNKLFSFLKDELNIDETWSFHMTGNPEASQGIILGSDEEAAILKAAKVRHLFTM